METGREGLEGLVGDDGEAVDLLVVDALAGLVDGKAEAAADHLAPLGFGPRFAQGADLEDVRVVPAFAQGGVGEDEAERLVKGEEFFLVLHDQSVGRVILN